MVRLGVIGAILCFCVSAYGADKKAKDRSAFTPIEDYVRIYSAATVPGSSEAPGSLWHAGSRMADISADVRARQVNDLVTIRIAEQTLAEARADVSAARQFKASGGISSLAGKVDVSGIASLFSAQSDQSLNGKGQANSQTRLRTSVAGRIAAVLPNGVMVIEAERRVRLNHETQTILLRGMVRPADVMSDNTVLSTSLANLEIELRGKGVVSDATRPPNRLIRALLWLTGF